MVDTSVSGSARRARGRPRSAPGAAAPEPVKGLDTGLVVLRALAAERCATLTNLALSAGTSPSTAYRMLATLARHGLVEFDERTQEWTVGIEAFRVGSAFLARTGLVEVSRPAMASLMHDTRETANLGVAHDNDVVFLAQVEARHPIRAFHDVGSRGALHASGIGKALLAELDPAALDAFVARSGLPRFTAATLADPETLAHDLATTRSRGWSLDDGERHEGMRCVAAAIFDAAGCAVAGVSVSGPSVRFPDEALGGLGERVRETADTIGERLGARVG